MTSSSSYFPSDKFIIAGRVGVNYGIIHEPGHDCNLEDHHVSHDLTVLVVEVTDLENPNKLLNLAIPVESEFFDAIMDGSLRVSIDTLRARFAREIDPD